MSRLQEVLGQKHEACYIRQTLMEFKSPKYYAEMRAERRKLQAASLKHQAAEAPSCKPQAPSSKLQAPSRKRQAP